MSLRHSDYKERETVTPIRFPIKFFLFFSFRFYITVLLAINKETSLDARRLHYFSSQIK